MTRRVAGVIYDSPADIPARYRKVALVLDADPFSNMVNWSVNPVLSGQTPPADMVPVGAVLYKKTDTIPVDMLRVAPVPNVTATPEAPTLGLGSEIVVNGGFGTDTVWAKDAGWSIADGVATHSGDGDYISQDIGTANLWYILGFTVTARTAGYIIANIGASGNNGPARNTAATFAEAGRMLGTARLQFWGSSGPISMDDVSLKNTAFSAAGCLKYVGEALRQDGIYECKPTVSAGYHAGLVIHADSATAPDNCLYAYYDRSAGKAYFLKIVEGTTTELQSEEITYSAGAILRIISNGTSHACYYNGNLVGSIQTSLDVTGFGKHIFAFQTAAGDSVGALSAYV